MGCFSDIKGDKPPEVYINVGNESYETILGYYCWEGTCIDTDNEVSNDTETIKVKPGETISFAMEYEPQPSEVTLTEFSENKVNVDISVIKNQFTAPTQKGIYYYSYVIWWLNEVDKNVSNDDASYHFALEVK